MLLDAMLELPRHPRMPLAGTHVMPASRLRGNDDRPIWQHPAAPAAPYARHNG